MGEMIPCLILGHDIPRSRCRPREHPTKCPECRIDRCIRDVWAVNRKAVELAFMIGRREVLLEDHKRQVLVLKKKIQSRIREAEPWSFKQTTI